MCQLILGYWNYRKLQILHFSKTSATSSTSENKRNIYNVIRNTEIYLSNI